ncbi:MAG: hypothetical protein O2816_02615 [Planctomycetota bacterium]|nr:hypothetical protein [Planctomycetota bacterium]
MRAIALVLLGLVLAQPCWSQDQVDLERDARVLQQRHRETLHPYADPNVIVGREQDGNGFRDRTPALLRSVGEPVQVDADDLYERKLAMYDGRASFRAAPDAVQGATRRHRHESLSPESSKEAPSAPPDEEDEGLPWGVIAALAAVAGFLLLRRS